MTEINPNINTSHAEQIARNLDRKDGKEDGKIQASIWNEYAETTGGNKIKNCITLKNAIASITTYIKRGSEKTANTGNNTSQNNVVATGVISDLLSDKHIEIGEPQTPEEEFIANRPLAYVRTKQINKPLSQSEIDERKKEAKECVDSVEVWAQGNSRCTKNITKDTAAYFVEEYLARGYNLNAHMHINVMLPNILTTLLDKANELGIKSDYANKNLNQVHFTELAQAIKDLSDQIIYVEKNGSGPSIWADENK